MNMKRLMILLGILVFILLWAVISIYPNWLWFKNLGFAPIFWTMIWGKFGLSAIIWVLMIVMLSINLYLAQRFHPGDEEKSAYIGEMAVSGRTLNTFILAAILIVSLMIASRAAAQWDMVLSFINRVPFGTVDPIFNKDIGFYIFTLPFHIFIREELLVLVIFAAIVTIIWYFKDGGLQIIESLADDNAQQIAMPKINISKKVGKHLLVLGGIIVLLLAWGYHLRIYGLLYSTQGPAFGASYTDIHIRVPVFRILMVLTALWGLYLIYSSFKPNKKQLLLSGAIWLGAILVLSNGLPVLIQKTMVKPNELAKESQYIAYNIEHTRKAYKLNDVKEVDFVIDNNLGSEDLDSHKATIQNIRVWDERPLLQTYKQIQSIRLYYDFNNVDVDRYVIDGKYRQVMLGARELVVDKLPPQAKTWVNKHITYTHGYGLAMSPVNEVTEEGLPELMIKDLPPVINIDIPIDRPEIYYGEKTEEYILVKTDTQEFDYPKGDSNVYTNYEGKGGVPIKSFLRRCLFAIEFLDPQILFTQYLNPDSRIMYNRRIDRRVNTIAPFLDYDTDPYMMISNGKLYWIQDAYTTSNMYPYSKRTKTRLKDRHLNYIRNSVKVITDAYNGDVTYYMIDEKDPVLKTYAKIFPELFKPSNEMPKDMKDHIRYPKDLFDIQVNTYSIYHMQDVQVFYNQEDLWEPPDEKYGEDRQTMKPYYLILKLPEEEKEEYLLMLPYTPSRKDNMIGWLAARSDMSNYGNLIVYKLPKEKLVYGPMQIEARVDQQTEISRELSLWDQRGSRVIRGNLLAIPIANSFLYVEPIYLEAKQEVAAPTTPAQTKPSGGIFGKPQGTQATRAAKERMGRTAALPELKRVIVALGNQVTMADTLDKALKNILGDTVSFSRDEPDLTPDKGEGSPLGAQALEHYYKARDYLKQGDWAGYGRELENLENLLKQMANKSE
ncbi:UPF0182 family protein [Thermodesulfobacteriota bacterium]